ncbi:hypothetical protein BO78DRAFT_61030 [Aspergillus sclerotiicarbonarius CBS 121057]|uniref:Uncharacterized protein n=1 Tax=Aspergillus sclerotiicarbonarius (strain CBS 121057 / IBT 28362) TaxID=1448318 RepID=A0A319EW33_ASPSB|nr:hypothetical protein BO78DRAFT_61030 [Aspergillus sclerotiicarbonarius CBS 121057]
MTALIGYRKRLKSERTGAWRVSNSNSQSDIATSTGCPKRCQGWMISSKGNPTDAPPEDHRSVGITKVGQRLATDKVGGMNHWSRRDQLRLEIMQRWVPCSSDYELHTKSKATTPITKDNIPPQPAEYPPTLKKSPEEPQVSYLYPIRNDYLIVIGGRDFHHGCSFQASSTMACGIQASTL